MSTADWVQVAAAVTLAVTAGVLAWTAFEIRQQAKFTADLLDDQRRTSALDTFLQFHGELLERLPSMARLAVSLARTEPEDRLSDKMMAEVVPLLNRLDGYGHAFKSGLVPQPTVVVTPMAAPLSRFLDAAVDNIRHARSFDSSAFSGIRWFEETLRTRENEKRSVGEA